MGKPTEVETDMPSESKLGLRRQMLHVFLSFVDVSFESLDRLVSFGIPQRSGIY